MGQTTEELERQMIEEVSKDSGSEASIAAEKKWRESGGGGGSISSGGSGGGGGLPSDGTWKPDFTQPNPWAGMPPNYEGIKTFVPTPDNPNPPWVGQVADNRGGVYDAFGNIAPPKFDSTLTGGSSIIEKQTAIKIQPEVVPPLSERTAHDIVNEAARAGAILSIQDAQLILDRQKTQQEQPTVGTTVRPEDWKPDFTKGDKAYEGMPPEYVKKEAEGFVLSDGNNVVPSSKFILVGTILSELPKDIKSDTKIIVYGTDGVKGTTVGMTVEKYQEIMDKDGQDKVDTFIKEGLYPDGTAFIVSDEPDDKGRYQQSIILPQTVKGADGKPIVLSGQQLAELGLVKGTIGVTDEEASFNLQKSLGLIDSGSRFISQEAYDKGEALFKDYESEPLVGVWTEEYPKPTMYDTQKIINALDLGQLSEKEVRDFLKDDGWFKIQEIRQQVQDRKNAMDSIPSEYKIKNSDGTVNIDVIGYLNDSRSNAKTLVTAIGSNGEDVLHEALAQIQNDYLNNNKFFYKLSPYADNYSEISTKAQSFNPDGSIARISPDDMSQLNINNNSLIKFMIDNKDKISINGKDYSAKEYLNKIGGYGLNDIKDKEGNPILGLDRLSLISDQTIKDIDRLKSGNLSDSEFQALINSMETNGIPRKQLEGYEMYQIAHKAGNIDVVNQEVVKIFNSLPEYQQRDIALSFSQDVRKDNIFAEVISNVQLDAQRNPILGLINAPTLIIGGTLAKQVTQSDIISYYKSLGYTYDQTKTEMEKNGQTVTKGEWFATGLMAAAVLIPSIGLVAGIPSKIIVGSEGAIAGYFLGTSIPGQIKEWGKMTPAEKGVAIGGDILMVVGVGLGAKGMIAKAPSGVGEVKVPTKVIDTGAKETIAQTGKIESALSKAVGEVSTSNKLARIIVDMDTKIKDTNFNLNIKSEKLFQNIDDIIAQLKDYKDNIGKIKEFTNQLGTEAKTSAQDILFKLEVNAEKFAQKLDDVIASLNEYKVLYNQIQNSLKGSMQIGNERLSDLSFKADLKFEQYAQNLEDFVAQVTDYKNNYSQFKNIIGDFSEDLKQKYDELNFKVDVNGEQIAQRAEDIIAQATDYKAGYNQIKDYLQDGLDNVKQVTSEALFQLDVKGEQLAQKTEDLISQITDFKGQYSKLKSEVGELTSDAKQSVGNVLFKLDVNSEQLAQKIEDWVSNLTDYNKYYTDFNSKLKDIKNISKEEWDELLYNLNVKSEQLAQKTEDVLSAITEYKNNFNLLKDTIGKTTNYVGLKALDVGKDIKGMVDDKLFTLNTKSEQLAQKLEDTIANYTDYKGKIDEIKSKLGDFKYEISQARFEKPIRDKLNTIVVDINKVKHLINRKNITENELSFAVSKIDKALGELHSIRYSPELSSVLLDLRSEINKLRLEGEVGALSVVWEQKLAQAVGKDITLEDYYKNLKSAYDKWQERVKAGQVSRENYNKQWDDLLSKSSGNDFTLNDWYNTLKKAHDDWNKKYDIGKVERRKFDKQWDNLLSKASGKDFTMEDWFKALEKSYKDWNTQVKSNEARLNVINKQFESKWNTLYESKEPAKDVTFKDAYNQWKTDLKKEWDRRQIVNKEFIDKWDKIYESQAKGKDFNLDNWYDSMKKSFDDWGKRAEEGRLEREKYNKQWDDLFNGTVKLSDESYQAFKKAYREFQQVGGKELSQTLNDILSQTRELELVTDTEKISSDIFKEVAPEEAILKEPEVKAGDYPEYRQKVETERARLERQKLLDIKQAAESAEQRAKNIEKIKGEDLRFAEELKTRLDSIEQRTKNIKDLSDFEKRQYRDDFNKTLESLKTLKERQAKANQEIISELEEYLKNPNKELVNDKYFNPKTVQDYIDRLRSETQVGLTPEETALYEQINKNNIALNKAIEQSQGGRSETPQEKLQREGIEGLSGGRNMGQTGGGEGGVANDALISELSTRLNENIKKLNDISLQKQKLASESFNKSIEEKLKELGYNEEEIGKLSQSRRIDIVANNKKYISKLTEDITRAYEKGIVDKPIDQVSADWTKGKIGSVGNDPVDLVQGIVDGKKLVSQFDGADIPEGFKNTKIWDGLSAEEKLWFDRFDKAKKLAEDNDLVWDTSNRNTQDYGVVNYDVSIYKNTPEGLKYANELKDILNKDYTIDSQTKRVIDSQIGSKLRDDIKLGELYGFSKDDIARFLHDSYSIDEIKSYAPGWSDALGASKIEGRVNELAPEIKTRIEEFETKLAKEKAQLERIADKLEKGDNLSVEEQRIRIDNADEIENILKERFKQERGGGELPKEEKPITGKELDKLIKEGKLGITTPEEIRSKFSPEENKLQKQIDADEEILRGLNKREEEGYNVENLKKEVLDRLNKTRKESNTLFVKRYLKEDGYSDAQIKKISEIAEREGGFRQTSYEDVVGKPENKPIEEKPITRKPIEPEKGGGTKTATKVETETKKTTEQKVETKPEVKPMTDEQLRELMERKTKAEPEKKVEDKPSEKSTTKTTEPDIDQFIIPAVEGEPYYAVVWENGQMFVKLITPEVLTQGYIELKTKTGNLLISQQDLNRMTPDQAQRLLNETNVDFFSRSSPFVIVVPSSKQQTETKPEIKSQPRQQPSPEPYPYTQPQPSPLGEPEPYKIPEPVKVPEPNVITEPETITVPKPLPIPQEIPEPETIQPPKIEEPTHIKLIKFPKMESKPSKQFTQKQVKPGTICWRQGSVWKFIEPPYGKNDLHTVKNPPSGVYKFATGPGSAYRTLQVLGGKSPEDVDVDLGWAKVHIGSKRGQDLEIKFLEGDTANVDKRLPKGADAHAPYVDNPEEIKTKLTYQQPQYSDSDIRSSPEYQDVGLRPEGVKDTLIEKIPKGAKIKKEAPRELRKTELPQYRSGRLKVYTIDGEWLRNQNVPMSADNTSINFLGGANGKKYPLLVPKNEIWLDRRLGLIDAKATLLQQLKDYKIMLDKTGVYVSSDIGSRNINELDTMIKDELSSFSQGKLKPKKVKKQKVVEESFEELEPIRNNYVPKRVEQRQQVMISEPTYLGHKIRSPELGGVSL